ncbi:hypothetical protein AAFC00_005875 [Neodothiora populina]|uniref:Exonuclease 1 n=1 Tax=Neodothiora populina TaxID=2781224 RepID=A0ABR3P6D9_9PEZI
MGVSGLLPLLKSIQKPTTLDKFSGQTIGVDAYGWLHRGTIACAIELAQGKPTTKWLNFVMNRVRMLIHFGVKPYLVFDGDYLPSKSGTEKDRAARRRESRKNGLEFLGLGKTSQAQLELQKSIDVTPEMARQLIDELKRANVQYVVAPYEADSQMVYLEKQGVIQAILSEDSDLLVFGAQCLLTKLDQYGACIMIDRSDFTACRDISLVGWSDSEFRVMSILSGCDYLASIDKMGLKTAYRLIRKHKTVERIVKAVQFDGKMKVPPHYLEAFYRAEATFLYQWVYCPRAQGLVNLSPPSPDVKLEDFPCIGRFVEPHLATGVAKGDLHPHTKQPIVVATPARPASRPFFPAPPPSETPDLKKNKSIESFFKRTPLAELDPNSFTPSPSQRQLLHRSPASWSAEPAVTRRPLMASNSPFAASSAPQRTRRAVTDTFPPTVQSPPKRQRLCSDGHVSTPTLGASLREISTSKFFPSRSTPSIKRAESGGKAKKSEFNLWSDDSVEEAMSQLADQSTSPRPRKDKKLAVFNDTSETDIKEKDDGSKTGTSPLEQSNEDEAESIFTPSLKANVGLLRQFTYSSAKTKEDSTNPAKPESGNESSNKAPEALVPCSSPILSAEQTQEDTHSVEALPTAFDSFAEADWTEAESRCITTTKTSEIHPHETTTTATTTGPKGSEDMIVPDSEGEEDNEEMLATFKHTGFSLNLGRFAFSG